MGQMDMQDLLKDVQEIKKVRKFKRRLRSDPYLDLRPMATHILGWARVGGSKRTIKELVRINFEEEVSADRIYRFVVLEIGQWPRSRKKTWEEE